MSTRACVAVAMPPFFLTPHYCPGSAGLFRELVSWLGVGGAGMTKGGSPGSLCCELLLPVLDTGVCLLLTLGFTLCVH